MKGGSLFSATSAQPQALPAQESTLTPIRGSGGMRYRPLKQLGAGGMARVLLACGEGPSGFTKLVVLKVMRRELLADARSREMFLTEARLSARLNHPNLVQVNEVIQSEEVPYLVMEHLDGKPLSSIKVDTAFDQAMMLTVIAEALIGLHHAHELRDYDGTPLAIVHRDISPHNVFVTYDGVVKVLDFGIAQAATSSAHTENGEIKGKLAYMAPEQLLGEGVDRRADIFSIGCMLWETAVGSRLWDSVSAANLVRELAVGNIPRPSARAAVHPELERIIVKATAAEPQQRYSTALDLQRDLEAYLVQSGLLRPLRDIGIALAGIFRDERQEQSRLIRHAMRDGSNVEVDVPESKADVAYELSVKEKRPSRNWLFVTGAVLVTSAVGVIVAQRLRTAPVVVAPPPAAAASVVMIRVRATPAQATIAIDGKEHGSGTTTLSVSADPRERSIHISAPGFVSETRVLAFNRTQVLDVTLKPLDAAPEPPPVVSAPLPGKPVSRARAARTAPRPSADSAAARKQCAPPYYFVNGIKTFRPECL